MLTRLEHIGKEGGKKITILSIYHVLGHMLDRRFHIYQLRILKPGAKIWAEFTQKRVEKGI